MASAFGGNPCWNCGDNHTPDEVCAINWEARLTGHEDSKTGEPAQAAQWPRGQYGHADYWIGFYGSKA